MTYWHPFIELEYYVREGISPVHYNFPSLKVHFQTRASLCRLLGLVLDFVRGKDILEIAPGSGHNSIYTASLCRKNYDLVEPNSNGCKDILKIFKRIKFKHTKPRLFLILKVICLKKFIFHLKKQKKFCKKKHIKIKDVSSMKYFNSFFGQEQCYLSFINES